MGEDTGANQAQAAQSGEEPLVLAMPRRELFRISGFTTKIELDILESVVDESWYALPSTLVGNLDAKEVRLGLVFTRAGSVLVGDNGCLLHTLAVPPEVGQLGKGLRALRELAAVTSEGLLGSRPGSVQLIGYCNEDSLPEVRQMFLMVYRCQMGAAIAAPAQMEWIASAQLGSVALDPASALVVSALAG